MAKVDVRGLDLDQDVLDEVGSDVADEQFLEQVQQQFLTKTKHQSGHMTTHHKKQSNRKQKVRWSEE